MFMYSFLPFLIFPQYIPFGLVEKSLPDYIDKSRALRGNIHQLSAA